MTDAAATFVAAPTQAPWPLSVQLLSAAAFMAGYWVWSRHGYATVDRAARPGWGSALASAGALPIVATLYAAGSLRAWSYVVLLPACVGAIAIYGVYWSGHCHVAWMAREG